MWLSVSGKDLKTCLKVIVFADLDGDSRAFAVWVQGNSMTPEFNEGDLVIIDPDVAPLPGDFMVEKKRRRRVHFKKYRPKKTAPKSLSSSRLMKITPHYGLRLAQYILSAP